MLKEGVKGTQEIMVTEENTAKVMGSGALDVFATPAMIALMEKTAWESVQPYLEEGSGTVGTLMNVKHVAASPVGMKITCETELTKVELELFTPVKAIKGESPEITKREKAARDLFSTAVSKVRQPIESLFNWLNEKTNIQRAMKVRSTSGLLLHTMGKIAIALITLIFN